MSLNKSPQRFYKRRGGVEVVAGQTPTVEPGFLNPHQPVWRHGPYDGGARFVNQQDTHKFCFDLAARQTGLSKKETIKENNAKTN